MLYIFSRVSFEFPNQTLKRIGQGVHDGKLEAVAGVAAGSLHLPEILF